jgi:hypothetical protein
MTTWARRLWWGHYSLAAAFWGFYVCGGIALLLVSTLLAVPLVLNDYRPPALIIFVVMNWSYWLLVSVGVWRSASTRKSHPIYEGLVKALIVLMVAVFLWRTATGGLQQLLNAI